MRKSAIVSRRVVLVDTGPLVAAINADDLHHRWAQTILRDIRGRAVTCESVIAEATHILENDGNAIIALHALLPRLEIVPIQPLGPTLALMIDFMPRMDFADACLVTLARREHGSIVLTTDTRDFSTYRVPFASPAGVFAE